MRTTVWKVRKGFLGEEYYVTPREFAARSWSIYAPVEVDIPERFKPIEDLEGRVMVTYGGDRYMLEEVLAVNRFGKPALVFDDQQFSAPHFISLPIIE